LPPGALADARTARPAATAPDLHWRHPGLVYDCHSGALNIPPMIRLPAILLLCAASSVDLVHAAEQQLDTEDSGISAQAHPTYSLDAKPRINRLDFDFRTGESTAWLNDKGDFHLQGWLNHRGLLCATYRMGVRFGIGAPGCLNVQWISDPVFVTSQAQCNGARVEHSGGDNAPGMGAQIGKITCAERVIRCSGSCK
jgi:hypothetical protein